MVDPKLNRRVNPLVDRFVTTDLSIEEIINNTPSIDNPCTQALLLIAECLAGKRIARDAIAAAEAAPIQSADGEMRILLLAKWAELSCRIGRPTEAQTLLHQAHSQLSDRTHPVIRATVLLVDSIMADTTGNQKRREEILRQALEVLSDHSARRKFFLWELAFQLATQGRGSELTSELRELTWQCNENFSLSRIHIVQFINAVEIGHIQEASQLMPEIATASEEEKGRNLSRAAYSEHQSLLALMHAAATSKGDPTATIPRPERPVWAQVVYHLLTQNQNEALKVAQMEARRVLSSIFSAGFSALNLVRAELACRHPEAAQRLLKMRQARGNVHYLDDFFIARAEYLLGNERAARRSFHSALDAVERYGAKGRLDFELQLATELDQGDIIALSKRVSIDSSKKTTDTETPDPKPKPGLAHRLSLRQGWTKSNSDSGADNEAPSSPEPAKGTKRLLGRSTAMQEIRETIKRFANLDAPVLITGETGTGKDLVARALHEESERRNHPFMAINCGTITETLLESELFGHEKGAFTGADRANRGLFDETGKGTIFLDEIGEVSPRLQMALLRVLESGEIRAIGSTRMRTIQCRIVAATHAPLQKLIEQHRFRQDLMYRLERLCIRVPPLRERLDDIMLLTRHFLDVGRPIGTHCQVSKGFTQAVQQYSWPGNVRELRNVIERMRLTHSDKLSYTDQDLDIRIIDNREQKNTAMDTTEAPAPDSANQAPSRPAPGVMHDVSTFLKSGRSVLRRTDRIKELFKEHRQLTRSELMHLLGIAPNTATKYLKTLCDEGFIRRVEPTASTRTHYFEVAE